MSIQRLLLASILSFVALAAMAPVAHVRASADLRAAAPNAASDLTLTQPGQGRAAQTSTDMVQPASAGQTRALDWFPFNSCFSFSSFCNRSLFGGCFSFFGGCRSMNFSACTSFFNFGCRTFNSSFFPFFNRLNFNFNFSNSTMANCIQIMRMPGGGTITIRVC
ncbi:MAG TPA: hypothetical protein VK821_02410 [Dehalococcoidia bacterium]|nr:hypothetical protein [Dehalococcoidia bacterium]